MGFHKRWVSEDSLLSIYSRDGIAGIQSYLAKADAFVTSDDLSDETIDIYNSYYLDKQEKWNEISHKIAIALHKRTHEKTN